MNGYYELKSTTAGKWMFQPEGRENHQVIVTSQGYEAKQGAMDGIESVRKNGVFRHVVREEGRILRRSLLRAQVVERPGDWHQ